MGSEGQPQGTQVSSSSEIKASKGKVLGIAITKTNATDHIEIKDGGASGTSKIIIGADNAMYIPLNIDCNTDIYATLNGTTAEYTVIYK